MALCNGIECFAFELFRKLWIRNGLPDYTKMVPDYPVFHTSVCPDDFCDTVFAFQCLCSSFFEELCVLDYHLFANSRSDFYFYLAPTVMLQKLGLQFEYTTLMLAVITAEMGIACARKDNYIFIFSCPLAFAMLFEDTAMHYTDLINAFKDLFSCGERFSHVRNLANLVKRSKSLRRDLIYRLQLLRFELQHSSCNTEGIIPDELLKKLGEVTRAGAVMDNSKLPTELFSEKFRAALLFPIGLQFVHQEQFVVYLQPLYEENFIKRQDHLRKCFFQEIADQCSIDDEEYKQNFITLYEDSVFGELAEVPPKPEITPDSSSAHELHDLDSNCLVSREIHVDDRDPDSRDAARRPEEHPGINSDAPSLCELYDLKPEKTKSLGPHDDRGLDARDTKHKPEEHSGIISDVPSLDELNDLKPKDSESRDPYDDRDLDALDTRHPPCGSAETNKRNVRSGHEMGSELTAGRELPLNRNERRQLSTFESSSSAKTFQTTLDSGLITGRTTMPSQPSYMIRASDSGSLETSFITSDTTYQDPLNSSVGRCSDFPVVTLKSFSSVSGASSSADASEFDDVQSNALMESHSKIEGKIEEGHGGNSSGTLDIFYKLRTMSDSQVSLDAFENSKLPLASRASELKDQEVTIDTNASELKDQEITKDTSASELKDQEITIDTSASELKDQEVIIDTSASELKDQEVTINTSASELKDQEVTIDKSASELKDQEVTIDTSASELKYQEVTIETSASILEDQGISIGTTFELRDPDISDDINVSKVKDQEISIDTYTSNLRDPEGVLDTGPFELIGVCIGTGALKIEDQEISSDTNDFDTRNQIILEDTGASKLDDEMIFSPDGSVSQNNAEGKNFEFEVVEFNSSKNITSTSEVYLKSKRVVKADELGNLSVTLHFNSSEIKNQEIFVDDSASECKNDGIFSAIDDSVFHGDSGEAHADFEILNKNSSPRNSMDVEERNEKTLLDDCQSSVFDIFSEQYLKLENNETASGDSNTLKFNDREVIDENCLEREDVFEEPVSSDSFPLQIKDVYSNKSPDEAFSKIESSPKTSSNSSEDSICTVASVETYRSKIAKNSENVSQPESKLPSELPREVLNPILEFGAKLQEMDKIIQQVYMLLEATHEELNTEHNDNKNDCCEYQIPSSPKPLSIGTINEDEEKSEKGSKKRKNRSKKKNEQDNDKETEGPTIVENGLEESEIIESDVYQLILIMGAPFEKPIKRDVNERFMERITIKSF